MLDERRAINDQFQQNTGVTFEQYVNTNMGVTRSTDEDGGQTESTDSHSAVDCKAVIHGQQQADAAGRDPLERLDADAVALLEAARQVPLRPRAPSSSSA